MTVSTSCYQSFSASQKNNEHVHCSSCVTVKVKNNYLHSDPFRILKVDTGGNDGTHIILIYLYLMKGVHDHYDDELEESGHWPLSGIFKVELQYLTN